MVLKKVDFSNYKIAIKIQKEIFPNEDGTLNILASLDRNIFFNFTGMHCPDYDKNYYLAYNEKEIVGITALYCEKKVCKKSAWLGWFGVLPKYSNKGYGEEILKMTINLAKEIGYTTIRLYTDINENYKAVKLYNKM